MNDKKQYINSLVEEILNESVILKEDEEFIDNYDKVNDWKKRQSNYARQRIKNKIFDILDSDNTDKKNALRNASKESGVNLDNFYSSKDEYYGDMISTYNLMNGKNISNSVRDDIINAIEVLRKYIDPLSGKIKEDMANDLGKENTIYIMNMKRFLDRQGLTYLYDKTYYSKNEETDEITPIKPQFGLPSWDPNKDEELFPMDLIRARLDLNDYSSLTPSEINNYLKDKKNQSEFKGERGLEYVIQSNKKTLVKRYIDSRYGMQFDVPSFSVGNMKLKKTLIINFSSAMGFPAWDNCLVKHACYARASEKGIHGGQQYAANEKKRMLWLTATSDPTLEELLKSYLRATVINYDKVLKKCFKNEDVTVETLIDTPLSEFDEEVLNVIAKNCIVRDIRFNENGDFLSQEILEMADRIAEEFKLIGVNTSAYTCMTLNYSNIRNIILNASKQGLDTTDPKGDNFARYFVCVPHSVYENYPDDVWEINNALETITPRPIETVKPNGESAWLYKCPCDHTLFDSKKKTNCYQCHMCYEPNKLQGGDVFVIVESHGPAEKRLNLLKPSNYYNMIGMPKHIKLKKPISATESSLHINSDILNSDEAVNTICDNAISSMNTFFKDRREINESFKKTYKRFFK